MNLRNQKTYKHQNQQTWRRRLKKTSVMALALAAVHFSVYAQKPKANAPKTLAVHVTPLKVSVTSVAVATKFQVYVGGGANISVPAPFQSPLGGGGGMPAISMSAGATFLAGEVESKDAKTKLIELQLVIDNPTEKTQTFRIGDLSLLLAGARLNDFVAVGYKDRLCAMSEADRRIVKQIVVEVLPKAQRTVSYIFPLLNPNAKQGAVVLQHSLPVTFQINAASSNSVAGYSQKPRINSTPTEQFGTSMESKTSQPISTPTAASETTPHFLEVGKGYERQADQATKEVLKADASGGSTAGLIGEEVHLYQEAIDSYTKAISLAPHDPEGYILRGMAYAKRDQAGRQSVVVQSSGGGLPTAVGAVAEFGPEAIADLNQAISLAPGDAEAYLTRGRIYEAQFHNKWIVYEKSVRLGSTQKAASSVKPDISLARNAVADFEKAIAINPQMGRAYEALGHLYLTCFRFADALKNYQEAQKFGAPQDPNLLAKLETIAQDPEKAGFTKSMLDQFPLAGPEPQHSVPQTANPIAISKSKVIAGPPQGLQTNSNPTKQLAASQESNENQPISALAAPATRLEAAIKRIDAAAALYEPKGYKFAGIVATQEANENAIIGILKSGDYFKATAINWRPLSAEEVSKLPKDIREDLTGLPKNPLVWLVNVGSLRDPAFDTQYQSLLNNARRALFGTLPGSVIFTLYPPDTPRDDLETNGRVDPSKLAYASLNYSVLSGAQSPSIANSPATVASARRESGDVASAGGSSYQTAIEQPKVIQASAKSSKPAPHAMYPARGYVWLDHGATKIGNVAGKGQVAPAQVFGFDEKQKKAGEVGGLVMTLQDTPVPLVIYSMNSLASGSMCGRYSDLILDFSATKGSIKAFAIGVVDSTDGGKELSIITLNMASLTELFISPDYIVFPGQQRDVQQNGPFALVDFAPGKAGGGGNGASTLILSRNGVEIARKKLGDGADFTITLKRVQTSNDVLEWQIENAAGITTQRGSLGFPMRGATPGVVRYVVALGGTPR